MALEALKAYAEAQKQQGNSKEPQPSPEPVNRVLTAQMEREKQSWELYKKVADNIRLSESLRCKINKDVKAGEPIYKLLLKAIECISLMTGDKLFYDMNKDYLQTIYGILGEPAAIEIERQEVEQRLKRLMAAYEQEQPADAKQRIKNAIKAHQEKLEKLQ